MPVPSLHSDGWRIELGIEGKPSSSFHSSVGGRPLWRFLTGNLASQFRVVAVDCSGTGSPSWRDEGSLQ
jgi:hypothetical protein